jgi:hypothetical protein
MNLKKVYILMLSGEFLKVNKFEFVFVEGFVTKNPIGGWGTLTSVRMENLSRTNQNSLNYQRKKTLHD